MADFGALYADRAGRMLEIRLQRLFTEAQSDVLKKLDSFTKKYEARDKLMRKKLEDGLITDEKYKRWVAGQVFQGAQWEQKVKDINASLMDHYADALDLTYQRQLDVFSKNANFQAYCLEHDIGKSFGFDLCDVSTVERLVKDTPELLPRKVVNRKHHNHWNQGIINNCITQGVIQGESIKKIAERIANTTANHNLTSATLYARTAMTSAQNGGRMEMLREAKEMGINVKKQWLATSDGRTRDSHRNLNGKIVDVSKPFISDFGRIDFPGDPKADPADVYNCRCTLVYVFPEHEDMSQYKDWEKAKEMTYPEWEEAKEGASVNDVERGHGEKPEEPERTIEEELADAYEYHRTANNLTSVPYDPNSELQFITSNVDLLDDDAQETIRDALGELTSKYDSPITQIGMFDRNDALLNKDAFAYTVHNYGTDTCKIMINPVKCKDTGKLVSRLKELRENGYCAFVPDSKLARYIIDHEFGHSLISLKNVNTLLDKGNFVNVDYKRLRTIRKKVVSIFDEYKEEIGKLEKIRKAEELKFIMNADAKAGEKARQMMAEIKKIRISNYSLKDPDEFFAEAFVYTEHGGTDNKYANLVREIIQTEFAR